MRRLLALVVALALAGPAFAQQTGGPVATRADGSTTITLGGSPQNLFGGVIPSNGAEVCNPDPSVDLWVSDSTTAAANGAGSERVPASGGCYIWRYQPLGPISVVGATTGKPVSAKRW